MKTKILVAVLALSSLALQAADRTPLVSPRAKSNASRVMAGESKETLDRSFPYAAPRAAQAEASRKSIKGTNSESLNRKNIGIAAKVKDQKVPRSATSEFQVAPAK